MKNKNFEWNRFCKVVKKDFRNLWPMFGPTMLILAALPFAVWLFMAVINRDMALHPDIRLMMIEGVAMLAAIMAPSRMYRTWNLRNKGIYFAMLPASKLEKFCSALLFSLIICPLAVFVGSMALDMFLTALPFGPWREWLWQGEAGFPFTANMSFFENMAVSGEGAEMFSYYGPLWIVACWISYIASVLMFVFTSTLFKCHKVLYTILWLYLIEFVISIILIPVFIAVFTNTDFMEWLYDTFLCGDPEVVFNWIFWGSIVFDIILAGLCGWFSWRRLKNMPY